MKIHALWLSASVVALACGGIAHAQAGAQGTPPVGTAADPAQGATSGAGQEAGQAQAGGSAPAGSAQVKALDELVVTAERRTTNLQTTAIAATVLNQTDLISKGVFTIDQLQFVSPSLAVDNFGQGNDVDIRGIGKGEHNTQTSTGVVTYRDGVAGFPGYFQEEPYYDVANVQVLRGPQGTFSGQNSTGGAVIVNTQDPVIGGGHHGYLFGHYGNYNDTGLQGAVNLPISDTLAARVAFNGEYRDSFYNIKGLPEGDPNVYWGSARFSLLWTPTSNLKVLLKLDYDYLKNGGYFGDAILDPTGQVNGTDNLFDFSNNYKTYALDHFVRSIVRVDYLTDSGYTFRSVSGFQKGQTAWTGDIDGRGEGGPNYVIAERSDETLWSQEFNIISPDNKPVTWVLGAYYNHNFYDFPKNFVIGVPIGGFDEDFYGTNTTHTYAAFGQVSVNLPHGLQVQGGLRYSRWSTNNDTFYFVPEYGTLFDQAQGETYTGGNLTGKLALNWKIDPNNFAYAFVATGAKPGGLNTTLYAYPQQPIPGPFGQEKVTDYEVGLKSRFLDGHLRTQVGAYYNLFKNFQVAIPLPNNPRLVTELNVTSPTKLYGVEGQVQAVFGNLSVNGGVGIEHSALGRFFVQDPRGAVAGTCDPDTGPSTPTCINLKGHAQTYAPSLTANVQVQYNYTLPGGDVITPQVQFSHISDQWSTLFENRATGDHLDPRNILAASVAWTHGTWTATLYGYNLTDQHYVSANLPPIRIAGAPRQFGISILKPF